MVWGPIPQRARAARLDDVLKTVKVCIGAGRGKDERAQKANELMDLETPIGRCGLLFLKTR